MNRKTFAALQYVIHAATVISMERNNQAKKEIDIVKAWMEEVEKEIDD